ncbi:MAG TPA: tetratricopeptide repeat protein [Chthonomonadaceae bacterium]|nr:tetratricopeptide repeat protein [Chthonomonadaceae bacterium]
MNPSCSIQLLGGLRVQQGDQALTRFRTQKTASLLAYLAYFRKRAHLREDLIELFWPDTDPEAGRMSLRTALSALRRQLEPHGIEDGSVLWADRRSVQLSSQTVSTDIEQLEAALRAASKAEAPAERIRRLKEAVAVYKGPLLPGFYEDWVLQERERLEQAYAGALKELTAILEQTGDLEGAIAAGHRLVAVDPLSEEGYAHLMRLYAAAGQPEAGLQQYITLAQLWDRELGETPSAEAQTLARRLQQACQEAGQTRRSPEPPPPQPLPSVPVAWALPPQEPHLPLQLSRFFGREEEIEQIRALLYEHDVRLLTLTGPGGSGKTRLAIEAARKMASRFEGRIWFVPLADVSDASSIAASIAHALQLPLVANRDPLEQITQALSGRSSLLVLDNFEQLAEKGTRTVLDLLDRIPALQLLVTSRQRLDVGGERELAVAPLPAPTRSEILENGERFASVQLLVDRAQAARPGFAITPENAEAVTLLCERLEGIPQAIELAAAWAGTLTPAQMLARLEHRFELLAGKRKDLAPRHRTLRATIEWSYRLLPVALERFFASLSVFRGGWSLAAVEAICSAFLDYTPMLALDYLQQLRERSLIVAEETEGEMRFRLLETLRDYAAEQLLPEEREALQRRHLEFFAGLVRDAQAHTYGPREKEWLDRLEREHDNLRAALEWARSREETLEGGLQMAGRLERFWQIRGYWQEGREQIEKLLARPGAAAATEGRAMALTTAGVLAGLQADYAAARAYEAESLSLWQALGDRKGIASALHQLACLKQDTSVETETLVEQSLALRRDSGDKAGIGFSLLQLGNIWLDRGEFEKARSFYEQSMAVRREIGDQRGIATALNNLGVVAEAQRDYAAADRYYRECLEISRQLGDRWGISLGLGNLSIVARLLGDYERARKLNAEALRMRRELGDRRLLCGSLEEMGRLAMAEAQKQRSARLLGAAQAMREAVGILMTDNERVEHEANWAKVRASLGDTAFSAAWEEGHEMPLEQAIAYALDFTEPAEKPADERP